jgi:cell wall-associated NlpC family hydrolase
MLAAVLVAGTCLTVAPVASSALPRPPVPPSTSTAVGDRIQQAKDRADNEVVTVTGTITQQAKHIAALTAAASLAEQHYTEQQAVQAEAQAAEVTAQHNVALAHAQYDESYRTLVASAVSVYESADAPNVVNSIGSLLVVDDPSALLNVGTEQQMFADHQSNIVTRMKFAEKAMGVAEQRQRAALATVEQETARLATIRSQADAALTAAQSAMAVLRANLTKAKETQKRAATALATFIGGWSGADPARAGALNRKYEAIALRVRHLPPAPASPTWTAGMARTAVNRALQFLGTPYAWAGGSASGPTTGVCVAGAARNDCHVTGFDCSGLALYAWAPYLSMQHSAEIQYGSGSLHPSISQLRPGDLVFWSNNNAVSGIHHVAIYVGDGNVIQAPESGDIVRITPLGSVSSGYFGATRPLS